MTQTYLIRVHTLQCFLPDEGTDEVYLMYKDQKVWPSGEKYKPMKEDVSLPVKIELEVIKGATATIELWEFDTLSADDNLGKFLLKADEIGGPYNSDMIKKDKGKSKYGINWEVTTL